MLIGEQLVPIAKRVVRQEPVSVSWFSSECAPKITGLPPRAQDKDGGPDGPPAV
ncbi:hypothetical protein D9M70_591900 [compost metagenome]